MGEGAGAIIWHRPLGSAPGRHQILLVGCYGQRNARAHLPISSPCLEQRDCKIQKDKAQHCYEPQYSANVNNCGCIFRLWISCTVKVSRFEGFHINCILNNTSRSSNRRLRHQAEVPCCDLGTHHLTKLFHPVPNAPAEADPAQHQDVLEGARPRMHPCLRSAGHPVDATEAEVRSVAHLKLSGSVTSNTSIAASAGANSPFDELPCPCNPIPQ